MANFPNPFPRFLALASMLVLLTTLSTQAVDSDGDGRLDVLDAPRYDKTATGTLVMTGLGIEDLDGVSELSSELLRLYLGDNQITEIQRGDLTGLNTQYLFFYNNQITTIEPYAFEGLTLRDLNLNNNHYSDLHLEGGIYEALFHLGIDRFDVKRLYLDDAQISAFSYDEVVRETTEITDLSIVGTTFIGEPPSTLSDILDNPFLENVSVDRNLFDLYSVDFNNFAASEGKNLSIIEALIADCNQSGAIDFSDLDCVQSIEQRDEVLSALSLRPGDLDGNGTVVFADFLLFARNFGLPTGTYLQGNLNLEGNIGFNDFLILAENFSSEPSKSTLRSPSPAGEPVPEPDTNLLLSLGIALFFHTYRGATRHIGGGDRI